ncbi:uncharacterized protein LOC110674641 [Aedes aegypti]|uniref:Uncharacterized protein n=1 Tax=Aedes aegypti TaxID=7159 RepID=A0A6I8U2Y8_AEDAE|nr:uncharacterized protein LOC110674641 [Aedes aegypti]
MKNLPLIFLMLCIAVKIHLSESFPQCCPMMCCSCGCGSGQGSSSGFSPPGDDPSDGQADDGLVRKAGKRHRWEKADTIISGVQAVADVGNLVKDVAQAVSSSGDHGS